MIDLHNHILPGIDDGAADLAESVAIGRQFVEEGVKIVAATPHLDPLRDAGAPPETVRRLVGELQAALIEAGVDLTVLPGQELFLTPAGAGLLTGGHALPLGASHYVLVEVSLTAIERPLYLDDALFGVQLAGYQPILAHPERYPFVQRNPDVLDALLARGVVLQVTAPSLLGDYGSRARRTAEKLLRRGAYSLAASDRHHPGASRSLALLHARLTQLVDGDSADLLLKINPAAVLEGRHLSHLESSEHRQLSLFARLFSRES